MMNKALLQLKKLYAAEGEEVVRRLLSNLGMSDDDLNAVIDALVRADDAALVARWEAAKAATDRLLPIKRLYAQAGEGGVRAMLAAGGALEHADAILAALEAGDDEALRAALIPAQQAYRRQQENDAMQQSMDKLKSLYAEEGEAQFRARMVDGGFHAIHISAVIAALQAEDDEALHAALLAAAKSLQSRSDNGHET